MTTHTLAEPVAVEIGAQHLPGLLGIPAAPVGLIIFAHGSGSGRFSPRNNYVAAALRRHRFATLLLDILTLDEESDRAAVFDIALLARRLTIAADWATEHEQLGTLPIGYFGASTGAGAAIVSAARRGSPVRAIVSRGGRPDLAGDALGALHVPTLLIVGSLDGQVIALNRRAFAELAEPKRLVVVPGAGHLFEEPGTLDAVIVEACRWFAEYLGDGD